MTPGDDWFEQARRLVAGLGQSLAAAAAAPAGDRAEGEAGAAAPHGSDCRWCPVCAAVGVLRGERPELTAALADALGAAAAALRTLAAEPGTAAEEEPPEAASGAQPGDGAPVVQRIEIA